MCMAELRLELIYVCCQKKKYDSDILYPVALFINYPVHFIIGFSNFMQNQDILCSYGIWAVLNCFS